MKKLLLIFIFALFFLSFVSSAPTKFSGTSTIGIEVEHPYIDPYKINDTIKFHFHIFNASNGLQIRATSLMSCSFHLYNSTGSHIFKNNYNVGSDDILDYEQIILGGNFTKAGQYAYVFQCNNSAEGGYYSNTFSVTPNREEATTGKAVFYIGLLFVLLFFFGISIYFFSDTDNLLTRVGSLGFAYLLLIAITFIAWNMASDFLTSSPFLIQMMRIVFFILLAGAFPLLVGMFAYYLIMLFRIKEIQRLMDRGIGYDEASKRAGSGGKYK
jgi:hypothetical protein